MQFKPAPSTVSWPRPLKLPGTDEIYRDFMPELKRDKTVIEAVKESSSKAQESDFKVRKAIIGVDGGITTGLTTTVRMKRPTSDPIQTSES